MKISKLPELQVISSTAHRRLLNKEQKIQIVKEAFGSGIAIAEYARRIDMHTSVLYKWRKKFIASGDISPQSNWHPQHTSGADSNHQFVYIGNAIPQESKIRILIGSDVAIECSAAVDPLQLSQLVRALHSSVPNGANGLIQPLWRPSSKPHSPAESPIDKE